MGIEAEGDESNRCSPGSSIQRNSDVSGNEDDGKFVGFRGLVYEGEDVFSIAGTRFGGVENLTSHSLTAWALARVSAIAPIGKLTASDRASQVSLASDNEENDDDDDDDTSRDVASFTSEKGLEAFSVSSDVVLPLRYTFTSETYNDESAESNEQSDVTASMSASSSSSSGKCASSRTFESFPELGAEAEDSDVDSNMTLGPGDDAATDFDDASGMVDDEESKASSSEFTPDQFWDWLDNVTVAFIEVNDENVSKSGTKRESCAGNVSSELTAVNSSCELSEPGSDPIFFNASRIATRDLERTKSQTPSRDAYWQEHRPHLKPSLSVADFRSAHEQQRATRVHSSNIRRTASFTETLVVSDSGSERLKRISSNEDLLRILRSRKTFSRLHSPTPGNNFLITTARKGEQEEELEENDAPVESMVCYDSQCAHSGRRKVVLLMSLFIVLVAALGLAVTAGVELPGRWKKLQRTVTVDIELSRIASLKVAKHAMEASTAAALGTYQFVKERLPESMEDVNAFLEETRLSAVEAYYYLKEHLPEHSEALKPRIVQLDFKTLASNSLQEAGELLKASKDAMSSSYKSFSAHFDDPRLAESLERLKRTHADARAIMMKRLTEICRSSAVEGPKEAMLKACDTLYDKILDLKVPYETPKETGPPHLRIDRKVVQEAFDAMANETLMHVSRFASIIHDLCSDVRRHCLPRTSTPPRPLREEGALVPNTGFLDKSSIMPPASEAEMEAPPPEVPSRRGYEKLSPDREYPDVSANSVVKASSDVTVNAVPEARQTQSAEPAVTELVTELIDTKIKDDDHDTTANDSALKNRAPENGSASGTEPIDSPDIESLLQNQEVTRKRVEAILSRLDAKGRLIELESILVERFGPDAVQPPKIPLGSQSLGFVPLLGKQRDQYQSDLWLRRLEHEVVEATLKGKMKTSNGFLWASNNIKRHLGSILDKVSNRTKLHL